MPSLVEKIESNAAGRLSLPPGTLPSQELARYRRFLHVESHRLKLMHRAGTSGRQVCEGRAALIDVLLRYLWTAGQSRPSGAAPHKRPAPADRDTSPAPNPT